jgi:hypothetical protein
VLAACNMLEVNPLRQTNAERKGLTRTGLAFVWIGAIASIVLLVIVVESAVQLTFDADLEERSLLTKPLRLEVSGKDAFHEFLIGLRTFHYRPQLQNVAVYSDVFYDTGDWLLFRYGYSYRFRQKQGGSAKSRYSIRFEREPRFVPAAEKKIDVSSDVPNSLGDDIVAGDWEKAVTKVDFLAAAKRLQVVLEELNIDSADIVPRLRARLQRERFAITDKGRNWFELDHELWSFQQFPGLASSRVFEFEDIAMDTRLNKRDPELVRRVRTMREFSSMIDGVRRVNRAPHERAVESVIDLSG